MVQIKLLSTDNEALWEAIVTKKHKITRAKLLKHERQVKSRYRHYKTNYDSLENITPLTSQWRSVKKSLQSCYGNNVAFSEAKKEMMRNLPSAVKGKCPYCMLSLHNTLDHYFDKSTYPEYSVYMPNLVPCCSTCNTIKGTQVFNNNGDRIFLHFYHDKIPQRQFLFIRFNVAAGDLIPDIDIYLDTTECGAVAPIIQRHFETIGLLKKYKASINDKLSEIIREIQYNLCDGLDADTVKKIIKNRYRSMKKQYGRNYWEACIYEGLFNSPDYFNSICMAIP